MCLCVRVCVCVAVCACAVRALRELRVVCVYVGHQHYACVVFFSCMFLYLGSNMR